MKKNVINKVKEDSKDIVRKVDSNRKYVIKDFRSNWKYILFIFSLIGIEAVLYSISKITPFERTILESTFDNKLPLITQFVYIYISWYILLFMVPYFLFHDKKIDNFYEYCLVYIIMVFISSIIFFIFPTEIIRPDINVKNLSSLILKGIYYIDSPSINCLPSMHCSVCFLYIYYSFKMSNNNKKSKVFFIILSILIIISTMLIKQHLIYDVIAALLLSLFSIIIVKTLKLSKIVKSKIEKTI